MNSSPPQNAPASPRRAAFLVTPHAGGTYTVFTNLRNALAILNITLDWVGESNNPDKLRADPNFADEMARGILIDSRQKSPAQCCAENVAAVRNGNYDLLFVNVFTSPSQMSVPAYLPPEILRVMIVHSITPATYSAARTVFPYVHAAVGVSPRIQSDLIAKKKFPEKYTFAAPNAIDFSPYDNITRPPRTGPFRLLFLGRMVDFDKGIFFLPEILRHLADLSLHLTIAGDGYDLSALKKRSADLANRITFLGRVAAADIPQLTASHDALIMPSRFEGLPYTLLEAMATGCVPVASAIRGSTDFVLQQNRTGLLFPIGDTAAAALAIRQLVTDEPLYNRLSAAGRLDARQRFSTTALAQNYLPILNSLASPRPLPTLLLHQSPSLLPFGGAWRRLIPQRFKNYLRGHLMR